MEKKGGNKGLLFLIYYMLQQTTFIKSAAKWQDLPPEGGKEVAFWGRSNVGKSTTLNALCQQKALARTGRTPGVTTLLNYFQVIPERWLVDLPGYGYAQSAKHRQEQWNTLITQYLEERQSLVGLILIMDIRHPLTSLDQQVLDWVTTLNRPIHILLNKADKIGYGAQQKTLQQVKKHFNSEWITAQTFSAHSKQNLADLEAVINRWLD